MSALAAASAPESHRQLEPSPVVALAEALVAPADTIERTFVDAGTSLTESATLLGRIAARFAALPAELDSDELRDAGDRIVAIADGGAAMADALPRESEHLSALRDTLGTAQSPIWELRKAMRMLGIVAINARVVIAGTGDEGRDFGTFTQDITALSERASRLVRSLVDAHGELLAAIETAQRERAGFVERHHAPLAAMAEALRGGLGEISERRAGARGNTAETERLSREVQLRIAGAVSALQIGDTTRQRVEHVIAGLRALSGVASEPVPGSAGAAEAGDWHRAVAAAVTLLQARQLAAAVADFDAEAREVRQSLRTLSTEARGAIERSRSLYGAGASRSSSAISRLSGQARDVAAMLGECERERRRVDAMGQHVASVVEVLLEHGEAAREIEFSMRLMSLNAAVKSAQLGPRGRAVTVIAQQLRELTAQIVGATDEAMSVLERTREQTDAFRAAAAAIDAQHVAALEREAAASVALLSAADQRLADALHMLAVDGLRATELLAAAVRDFGAVDEIARQLSASRDALEELAPAAVPSPGPALAELLARLRKGYSMRSERQVHDELFPSGEQPSEGAATTVGAAEEDLLDADFF